MLPGYSVAPGITLPQFHDDLITGQPISLTTGNHARPVPIKLASMEARPHGVS